MVSPELAVIRAFQKGLEKKLKKGIKKEKRKLIINTIK